LSENRANKEKMLYKGRVYKLKTPQKTGKSTAKVLGSE